MAPLGIDCAHQIRSPTSSLFDVVNNRVSSACPIWITSELPPISRKFHRCVRTAYASAVRKVEIAWTLTTNDLLASFRKNQFRATRLTPRLPQPCSRSFRQSLATALDTVTRTTTLYRYSPIAKDRLRQLISSVSRRGDSIRIPGRFPCHSACPGGQSVHCSQGNCRRPRHYSRLESRRTAVETISR